MKYNRHTRRPVAIAVAALMSFSSMPLGAQTYEVREPFAGVSAPAAPGAPEGSVTPASVVATPGHLTFAPVEVGQNASLPVTLTNSGSTPAPVVRAQPTRAFTMTDDCGAELAAGASCTANVTFAPTYIGTDSSSASIAGASFTMQGNGAAPAQPVAAVSGSPGSATAVNADFGTRSETEPGFTQRNIFVRNTGGGTLAAGFSVSGDSAFSIGAVNAVNYEGYAQSAGCSGSGSSVAGCTAAEKTGEYTYSHLRVEVRYAPTAAGSHSGQLTITHNGTNTAPMTVDLSGQAIELLPTAALSGTFGQTTAVDGNMGSKSITAGYNTKWVYLRNIGEQGALTSSVTLTPIDAEAGVFTLASVRAVNYENYGQSANCGGSGNALTGCKAADGTFNAGYRDLVAEVRFDPSVVGTRSAMLSFAHNGQNASPLDVTLTGTGTEPPPVAELSGTFGQTVALNPEVGTQNTTSGFKSKWVYLRNVGGQGTLTSSVTLSSVSGDANAFTIANVAAVNYENYGNTANCSGSGNSLTNCKAADGSNAYAYKDLRVEVRFDPATAVTSEAKLSFGHNGSNASPTEVTLSGTGYVPVPKGEISGSPGSQTALNTDFGVRTIGGWHTIDVYLRHTGTEGILQAPSISVSGDPAFILDSVWSTNYENRASGANCSGSGNTRANCRGAQDGSYSGNYKDLRITVRFNASSTAAKTGKLTITHNGSNYTAPIELNFTGSGI